MLFVQQALVFTSLLSSAFAAPHPHHDDSLVDWTRLNALLDSIDNGVLHNVLHTLTPKFRDGVFSKDRAAIEHVHSVNPVLASKIVYIAKRQDNGTTTAVESDPTTSDVVSLDDATTPTTTATVSATSEADSSSDAPASTPTTADTPASTTSSSIAPVAETVSAAVASQITATSVPDPTTLTLAPTTAPGETAIATENGAVVFSTEGGGVVTRTPSPVTVRFTRSTSTHLYYSTMADGRVVTSTSLVVVNAPVTETAVPTGAAGAAATSGGEAGLQNAAGRSSSNNAFVGLFLGAAGLFLGL